MTYDTQPISDAAGEAFNAALESGSPPDVCFEAGAEAATQMMGDMGAPPVIISEVITEAREDYEQGISDGMSPGDAFENIDTGSLGPDMGAIADAAHSAFEEAIEGGAAPADAFEAAAAAAGEECANQDIPPEMHEEATAALRTEFNEAVESGVDPMEAFDALEPPGMDEGMGAEYANYGGLDPMAGDSPMGIDDPAYGHGAGDHAGGPEGEGYAPPQGGVEYAAGPEGEGYAPPSDVSGMDALESAMGGAEDYPPPPDVGDVAMDSAMTQSANEEYAPPPDTSGGENYDPPPTSDDSGSGEDYAPPPPDDPGAGAY